MNVPQLSIGNGHMGFWSALDKIYPQALHQRYWVHKTAYILNSPLKTKQAIHQIWQAETKINAKKALKIFIDTYQDKYPKAILSLQKDRKELLALYDFPDKHLQSTRTTATRLNPPLLPLGTEPEETSVVSTAMVCYA